jgi:hypothetical protein
MSMICGVEGTTSGTPHVIVPQFSPQFPAKARFGINRMRNIQSFTDKCFTTGKTLGLALEHLISTYPQSLCDE